MLLDAGGVRVVLLSLLITHSYPSRYTRYDPNTTISDS